jgi:hypothetical protein
VYDPIKHRVKGTEAEPFLKMGQPKAVPVRYIFKHIKLMLSLGYKLSLIPTY